jgi:agmatinase
VERGDIVGIDLVEVSPPYDPSGITGFLAAQILLNLLGYIFEERHQRKTMGRTLAVAREGG